MTHKVEALTSQAAQAARLHKAQLLRLRRAEVGQWLPDLPDILSKGAQPDETSCEQDAGQLSCWQQAVAFLHKLWPAQASSPGATNRDRRSGAATKEERVKPLAARRPVASMHMSGVGR